jgi:hypothetical protein
MRKRRTIRGPVTSKYISVTVHRARLQEALSIHAGRNAVCLILGVGGEVFKRLFVHLISFLDMSLNI